MTRHKHELARLVTIRAPAACLRLMHVLLTTADEDGVTWVSVPWIAAAMPRSSRRERYVDRTVQLAARWWARAGCLGWDRVMPFGRYPARNRARELVPGQGKRTYSGGRVWRVNLPALRAYLARAAPPLPSVGMESGRYDLQIPSGYDLQIPSSDPSRSPSEILKLDPAPPGRERRAAASPPKVESETPRARSTAPSSPRPPPAQAARPAAAQVASEIPRADVARRASPPGPGPASERSGAQKGERGDGAAAARTPDVLAGPEGAARMARDLEALFAPRPAGTGPSRGDRRTPGG